MQRHSQVCSLAGLPGPLCFLRHSYDAALTDLGLHPHAGRVRLSAALPRQAGGAAPRLADLRSQLLNCYPRSRFVAPRTRAFIEFLLASLDARRRPALGGECGVACGEKGAGETGWLLRVARWKSGSHAIPSSLVLQVTPHRQSSTDQRFTTES